MRKLVPLFAVFAASAFTPVALADNLTGADRFLCSASMVTACGDDGVCAAVTAGDLNMPQFIEVDLKAKRLATTKASGLNRSTPILNSVRGDGRIVVQGYENGRAFSFVVHERSGMLTAAVATDWLAISVYGSCTVLP